MAIDLDALKCQVCHLAEPEENFLLCDGCTHGYHAPCLKQEMPQTRFWFCPDCGGMTVKGCVIQTLEKGGLAGITAAEINAGVLALRVSDLDRKSLYPVLVVSYNNTTVGERSRLVHGVHGRLDDGRCLVERLPPDEHGVVRYRLAPEESQASEEPQASEELAALSSPAPASQASLTEAAQASSPVDTQAAAAGAAGLPCCGDIMPAQNLDSADLPALQPTSSQDTGPAEGLCAAQCGEPAPLSMCLAPNMGLARLALTASDPFNHRVDAHGLRSGLETPHAAPLLLPPLAAPPVALLEAPLTSFLSSPLAAQLAARLAGSLATPLAGPLAAPFSSRPLLSQHSSESLSATCEGISLGTPCVRFVPHRTSTPAKQQKQQGFAEIPMEVPDQPAVTTGSADQAFLPSRTGAERSGGARTQDEEVFSDVPADMELSLHAQPSSGPGPKDENPGEANTVIPDSVEQCTELQQMEMDNTDVHEAHEEDHNADCVREHMILDPICHVDVHESNDSCTKAAVLVYEQGERVQQQDSGPGCAHAMALPHSRDGATVSAAAALAVAAAAAHGPASQVTASHQAGTSAGQALPKTPVVAPVRPNKRKREEEESVGEQAAPSTKHRHWGDGWFSICSDTLLSIYRAVLIVWLVHDMFHDRP